jgi:hypothetical protein
MQGSRVVETTRRVAVGVCLGIAAAYFALFWVVRDAESGASENTFGAYLFLAVAYLAQTVMLAVTRRRGAYVLTLAIQVMVIVLFILFGVGVFGPGAFDYNLLDPLRIEIWAVAIVSAQIALMALAGALLRNTAGGQADSGTPASVDPSEGQQ